MAAAREQYQITGKYINQADARETLGYHIASNNGKSRAVTTEQLAYLIGRGNIVNCTAQIYKDKLIFKGKGISLDDIPKKMIAGRTKKGQVETPEQQAQVVQPVRPTQPVRQAQDAQRQQAVNTTPAQDNSSKTQFNNGDLEMLKNVMQIANSALCDSEKSIGNTNRLNSGDEFIGLFKKGGNERCGLPAVDASYGNTVIVLHFAKASDGRIGIRMCAPRSSEALKQIVLKPNGSVKMLGDAVARNIHAAANILSNRQGLGL